MWSKLQFFSKLLPSNRSYFLKKYRKDPDTDHKSFIQQNFLKFFFDIFKLCCTMYMSILIWFWDEYKFIGQQKLESIFLHFQSVYSLQDITFPSENHVPSNKILIQFIKKIVKQSNGRTKNRRTSKSMKFIYKYTLIN